MTEKRSSKTVVVVGAGIIGVATALSLQRLGHAVTLIDRDGPASGASFGNGGVLVPSGVIPVTGPGLLRKAPGMLLRSDQPLFLKWSYLPMLFPWLAKYLSHANGDDTKRIARALHPLVGTSVEDHQELAAGTRAERWIVPSDYLVLYRDREHYAGDQFAWNIRRSLGIPVEEMEGDAVRAYDPVYSEDIGFAARLGDHGSIADPGRYVQDLASAFQGLGGRLVIATVEDLVVDNGIVTGVRARGETIPCDAAVIATGAWSKALTSKLGLSVPLETERGYHVELLEPSAKPVAPAMIASGKFVATPMDGRIRLAGIVEFGGLKAPPSEAPFALLERYAARLFPEMTWKGSQRWMGHRPALPDSIPLIGQLPRIKGAFLGFGHHHVGLASGAKTGLLLSQLVSGNSPNIDMAPYSPAKYKN